jgi:hypothetical protein
MFPLFIPEIAAGFTSYIVQIIPISNHKIKPSFAAIDKYVYLCSL